ncbi:MFS transporter [Tenggerimyces flavus]|uniref:MFS transporter n=1 Tax=Tenggerimyces flavus TaxID=1708749 RepID=A0ABV7Y888_9ACTN|nr:MFS transporter [Tenggerimyces flavus]MBM7785426.1 putative MFS family arabinose efflux permease [Tenggerimyces flavus]
MPRSRFAFLSMLLFVLVVQWDAFAVNLVLPRIGSDLGARANVLAWVVSAAMFASVAVKVLAGRVGDRVGLRKLVVVGYVGYAAASALCALAPHAGWLIGARIGQGLFGALVMTGGLALLASSYPAERRGRAIALAFGLGGIATVAGPVLGGLVADALGWPYVFWLEVPVALLGAVFALLARETVRPGRVRSESVVRNAALLRVIAAGSLANAAVVLVLFAVPWRLATSTAGAWMSVCSAALALGIAVSDRLAKVGIVPFLVVAGLALLATPLSLIGGVAAAAFCLGVVNGLTIATAMTTVPLDRAGEAAGLTNTALTLAGALAPALAGSSPHALVIAASLSLAGVVPLVRSRVRAGS